MNKDGIENRAGDTGKYNSKRYENLGLFINPLAYPVFTQHFNSDKYQDYRNSLLQEIKLAYGTPQQEEQ